MRSPPSVATRRHLVASIEDKRKRKRERLKGSIAVGVVTAVFFLITKGWHSVYRGGGFFASADEIPRRLVVALIFGVFVGLLFYSIRPKNRTVVCTSCGKAGFVGGTSRCSCGGQLEKLDDVKWR